MGIAVAVGAGLLSALLSLRPVSTRLAEHFAANYTSVSPETREVFLSDRAVGFASIPDDLLHDPAPQRRGVLGRWLARRKAAWPITEPAVPRPRVWVYSRARVVGPFLVLCDLDGAWQLRGATHQNHDRSLWLAFARWSVELSGWGTGAMYHTQGAANFAPARAAAWVSLPLVVQSARRPRA